MRGGSAPRRPRTGAALATLAALLAALAVAPIAAAREVWRRGEAAVELSGSLRELVTTAELTDRDDFLEAFDPTGGEPDCVPPGLAQPPILPAGNFEDCRAFREVGDQRVWQSLTRLRIALDWSATAWLSGSLVADNELRVGQLDTLEASLSRGLGADSFLGAEDNVSRSDHASWRTLLYRGFVRAEVGPAEAVVGRQRIAWGVARLWNPMDRFNFVPPLAIEGDQSDGVDAVLARWNFDGFRFLEAVYAPGSSRDEARYALRIQGVWWDTDVSIMGGVFERAPSVGFDLARNLGDAAFRMEAVFTDPEESFQPVGASKAREPGQYWQVVVSLDYNFDLGSGLYVLAEHLYNGNALGFGRGRAAGLLPLIQNDGSTSRAVFAGSQVVTAARHQTGVQVGYDLLSELRGELVAIYDWNGGSAVFYPALTYGLADFVELRAGAQLGVGPRHSQYGEVGTLGFLQADFYF
ncbi:MAG: hypothetical protein ACQGVK_17695 [Myxococcota bacterium]